MAVFRWTEVSLPFVLVFHFMGKSANTQHNFITNKKSLFVRLRHFHTLKMCLRRHHTVSITAGLTLLNSAHF